MNCSGADPGDVRRATELVERAADRVLEHLRLALELTRRVQSAEDDGGRLEG
ncbi:MAG: hypothetical protein JOZ07_02580 [Solirubrobacterales bacterium]|nr:hypothetical protein [Solirubrobacterales bacterium]